MQKRKPPRKPHPSAKARSAGGDSLTLRPVGGGDFELVHPRGVRDRAIDMAEVQQMLAAGEIDVATDELRWLLDGCRPFIEAHKLLGEIAAGDGDRELAQNHFGYAWQLGLDALPKPPWPRLPYRCPANRGFLEAGKGLAWCLLQAAKKPEARRVIDQLLALDPDDPLAVRNLVST